MAVDENCNKINFPHRIPFWYSRFLYPWGWWKDWYQVIGDDSNCLRKPLAPQIMLCPRKLFFSFITEGCMMVVLSIFWCFLVVQQRKRFWLCWETWLIGFLCRTRLMNRRWLQCKALSLLSIIAAPRTTENPSAPLHHVYMTVNMFRGDNLNIYWQQEAPRWQRLPQMATRKVFPFAVDIVR